MNTAQMTDDLIARGVRQTAIASFCGVNQSTVSRWRKGVDPEGPTRDRLFQLYQKTFGYLPAVNDVPDDADEMRAQLIEMFDRLQDPALQAIALKQVSVLVEQSNRPPSSKRDDPDGKPPR